MFLICLADGRSISVVGLDCGYEFLSRSAMVMEHAMGTSRYRGYFQLLLKGKR